MPDALACAGCPYCGCKPCTGYSGHMRAQCCMNDTRCGNCNRAPVLRPPCEQCGESDVHAPECEGEPRPETLSQALARAQAQADGHLRDRARRYLDAKLPRQGSHPRGRLCSHCRDAPRYPDHRCAEHTGYLPEGGAAARLSDSDDAQWLALWRAFFERMAVLIRT